MLVDPVVTRIDGAVPALTGRVEGAAHFAALVAAGALPQVTPAAFVLPLGLQGNPADVVTGLTRQNYIETVAVVLVIQIAGDVSGAASLPNIAALIDAVVQAIVGWAPGNQLGGAFELRRGALLSLDRGAVMYQLDFTIEDQLRIAA